MGGGDGRNWILVKDVFIPLTFTYEFEIPASAIDVQGHVNNIEYVRWMQEAAIAHSDAVGCTTATRELGALWVVRSHKIEYKRPAYVGERVEVLTWVEDCRLVSSRRKYEFKRMGDGVLLARGETDWVLLDGVTFRPKAIPESIQELYKGA